MAHQYSAFLHDDSIRLLKLLPTGDGLSEHGLICALEDRRLSDDPSYEALSYTWGQPIFSEFLHTHNGTLNITENLALALRRLRLKDRVRYLWVDAVCINQDDTTEKSQQVAMMGLIYKTARQVICWLGQSDESVGGAIETLKQLAASASAFDITEASYSDSTDAVLPTYASCTTKNSDYSTGLSWLEENHIVLRPYARVGKRLQKTCSNS